MTINKRLTIILILFMFISIITINSSMIYLPKYLGNLALKQSMWYIIGFIISFIIIKFYSKEYSIYLYFICLFLLLLVLIIGQPINGSKCWLIIPGIGSFQPSEFMKIAIILYISNVINEWNNNLYKINYKDELYIIIKVLFIILLPTILTFLEPETGVIFIYFMITFFILFISPIRKRWFIIFFIIIFIVLISFLYIYYFKKDLFINIFGSNMFYRIDRILDWKNGTGIQLENSLTAIGSSGLIGHGYMKTPLYFPESGTDFIFAVYASNFGIIGSIFLLVLLFIFDLEIINLSIKTKDLYYKYVLIGTIGMLLYQQIQNIGMTLGIFPITGITLPFISYGGSSLLSYFIIIGIIYKISYSRTIN